MRKLRDRSRAARARAVAGETNLYVLNSHRMTVNLSEDAMTILNTAAKYFGINADDVIERAVILYGRTLPPDATTLMIESLFPEAITKYKHGRRYAKLEEPESERSDGLSDPDRLRAASELFG